METCNSLYSTFYRSLQKDIPDTLPEHLVIDLSVTLLRICKEAEEEGIRDVLLRLSRLGKEFERVLITRTALSLDEDLCEDGSVDPARPRYFPLSIGYFLLEYRCPREIEAWDSTGEYLFIFLRQALLAFSKVQDIEPAVDINAQREAFADRMRRTYHPFNTGFSPIAICFART